MSRRKSHHARRLATADAETDPFEHGRAPVAFLWGYYDEKHGELIFHETEHFLDFVRKQHAIVYLHNGGGFDFHHMSEAVKLASRVTIHGHRLVSFRFGEAEFRDSLLLLPMALKAYRKDEIDIAKLEREVRHKHMSEIERYCRADCRYLFEWISHHTERYGRGLTLAGQAIRQLEEQCGRLTRLSGARQNARFYDHFRPFYYGGRVECFDRGILPGPWEAYDINSAYPHAMRAPHPRGFRIRRSRRLPDEPGPWFGHVRAVSVGALPLRHDDHSISFPRDGLERDFHATGWELGRVPETVREVHQVVEFSQTQDFTPFVDHFWAERRRAQRAGDRAAELSAKLILNSAYGKFAQDPRDRADWTITNERDLRSYLKAGSVNWITLDPECVLVEIPRKRPGYGWFNLATAASVTGYVRAMLADALAKADGPLYCDTDSIVARSLRVRKGKGLGMWKHEGSFVEAAIAGKKLYALKEKSGEYKTASKGVDLTGEEIYDVAAGGTVTHQRSAPTYRLGQPPVFIERTSRRTA